MDQHDLVDKLLPLTLFLGQRDEGMACFHAVGTSLLDLVAGAELVKQAVCQFAAVFQKVVVGRIANLGIAACGVDLHRATVVIAVLVGVDLLRLAAVRLRQQQGQQVEEFVVEALADQHEQLWNENGSLRELGKPKQILHVGILLDDLDGLLIAQPLDMLHYQSANNHAGGLIACTVVPVLQSLVVFLLYLVPGKIVGKLHPAVGLAQTRERLLTLKQLVTVVLGVVFYVDSFDFNTQR